MNDCGVLRTDFEFGLPRRANALLAMTNGGSRLCHCETPQGSWQSRAGTTGCVPIRSSLPPAASRNGWGMPHPYKCLSRIVCRAGTCPRRVQELPTAYKFVRLYRLPLRGTDGAPHPYISNYVRGSEHYSYSLFTIHHSLFTALFVKPCNRIYY